MACLLFSFKTDKKRTRVVFFGDSITEAGVHAGGYIAQMRDSVAAMGMDERYELIGAGIGGNKVYDLCIRLEEDVLSLRPRVVVLYVGVNDVWHKQLFGTGTDADKFQQYYALLIQKLQKKGIRVIACTPACIGERRVGNNPLDEELDFYSGMVRNVAEAYKVPLCDLRKAFLDYSAKNNPDDQASGILTTDGVHLNELGNKLVAERLLAVIKQILNP